MPSISDASQCFLYVNNFMIQLKWFQNLHRFTESKVDAGIFGEKTTIFHQGLDFSCQATKNWQISSSPDFIEEIAE